MAVLKKIKRAVRGEVKLTTAAREVLRRTVASVNERKERAGLFDNEPLALKPAFARMSEDELLAHFQGSREAKFLDGFGFATDTSIASANRIVDDHCWPLLGFGERCFGKPIQWTRDPLSNYVWPLDYHRDIKLLRGDGSDVRVLWELNRLGHFLTLASAYSSTKDERYAAEFLAQLRSWIEQNPYGRGPNWSCAMEVALRAINLLAAFESFRHSPNLDAASLRSFLQLLQQHGQLHPTQSRVLLLIDQQSLSVRCGWADLVGIDASGTSSTRSRGMSLGARKCFARWKNRCCQMEPTSKPQPAITDSLRSSSFTRFGYARSNGVKIEEKYWTKLKQMLIYVRSLSAA